MEKSVVDKFIDDKVAMLKSDFSEDQILEETYDFGMNYFFGTLRLDSSIHKCMELYALILLKYKQNT